MTIMKNKTIAKINKHVHVHDGVMMNVGLMRMMVVVVVMANDDAIDYHYVNHDDDHVHDHVLLNVDVVVDIV